MKKNMKKQIAGAAIIGMMSLSSLTPLAALAEEGTGAGTGEGGSVLVPGGTLTKNDVSSGQKIVFKKNAETATGTMEDIVVTDGEKVDLPTCTFENQGKEFSHWNTKADDSGEKFNDSASIPTSKIHELTTTGDTITCTECEGTEYLKDTTTITIDVNGKTAEEIAGYLTSANTKAEISETAATTIAEMVEAQQEDQKMIVTWESADSDAVIALAKRLQGNDNEISLAQDVTMTITNTSESAAKPEKPGSTYEYVRKSEISDNKTNKTTITITRVAKCDNCGGDGKEDKVSDLTLFAQWKDANSDSGDTPQSGGENPQDPGTGENPDIQPAGFTVMFKVNGQTIATRICAAGSAAIPPDITGEIPAGKEFDKWDADFSNVQGDMVINAILKDVTTPGGETPGGDTPGSDTPGSDTPGSDTPGSDTPGSDAPGSDTPGSDTPGSDTPGSDTPGSDTPGSDTPGSDTPGSDTPGSDTPGSDTPAAQEFTVSFVDGFGNTVKVEKVKKGFDAVAPETAPTKDGYVFLGWVGDLANIQQDTEIVAQWQEKVSDTSNDPNDNEQGYKVTFLDGFGNTIKVDNVAAGKDAIAPDAPTRDGYIFVGWDKEFLKVNSDLTVNAVWQKKPSAQSSDIKDSITGKTSNNGTVVTFSDGKSLTKTGDNTIAMFAATALSGMVGSIGAIFGIKKR